MALGAGSGLTWTVVIPVKVLARAKSRLAATGSAGGLADADREALALAMAADTVAAAAASPPVGVVIVVTDDPRVRSDARSLGAEVIADRPARGLNEALIAGAEFGEALRPGTGRAALTADLPALSAAELARALDAAATRQHAFVADAAGLGTTLYAAGPGAAFRPTFGPRSRERHLLAGAVELDLPGIAGLRRDVDTLDDLRRAAEIGLGHRSAIIGAALGLAGPGDPLSAADAQP
jgi:2-phospho-L-lactate guanylyltransferase